MYAVVDMERNKTMMKVSNRREAEGLADLADRLRGGPKWLVIETVY